MTLHAELLIRHTRRHMPTRRVAIGTAYLPMTGTAHGGLLLGAVVQSRIGLLDDEQREQLPRLLFDARNGLAVPAVALWYRMQFDTHGLDRSRHRVVEEQGHIVVELDVHGASTPQVLGAIMAAAALAPTSRGLALRAVQQAVDGKFRYPQGVLVRRLEEGVPLETPWAPGVTWQRGGPSGETRWEGIASERRWALEVLGCGPYTELERYEINRRFRRLLRDAHPDHGGRQDAAADRIAELGEARDLLLAAIDREHAASAGLTGGE
jgi:hypothetical protein